MNSQSLRTGSRRRAGVAHALILGVCVSLVGCVSTTPPRELLDARVAYVRATTADVARLKPAELHVAKEALDRAERTFAQRGDTQIARDMSYVALRRIETAVAEGETAAWDETNATGEREIASTKDEMIDSSGRKLKATERALSAEEAALERSKAQADEARRAADAEKEARLAAEKKATDAMDALARTLATRKDARGTVITISGAVLFATGKSELLPGARAQLDAVAEALKLQAERHFIVEGHTDNQGTDAVNDELSQKRAEAVRDYLIVRGVAAEAVSATGRGSHTPIGDNKSIEGRAMNRRVEIVVVPN
ncbi:MAG: OmpA family protein [Polyangiales bacterium]